MRMFPSVLAIVNMALGPCLVVIIYLFSFSASAQYGCVRKAEIAGTNALSFMAGQFALSMECDKVLVGTTEIVRGRYTKMAEKIFQQYSERHQKQFDDLKPFLTRNGFTMKELFLEYIAKSRLFIFDNQLNTPKQCHTFWNTLKSRGLSLKLVQEQVVNSRKASEFQLCN